ncbi:MAG: hypothetical protein IJ796_00955 [Lachnospiraceae bacterium]|nr:hypothetical protein [Lachnospiraceae bacterium]
MKRVRDWLLKDWWLKIVSLILAVVIWFVWIQIENPTISKDYSNVKVSIINESELNPDKKVWEILNNSDTLRVTVTAPKTVINGLTSDDIIAEADASKMKDNEIPITLRLASDVTYDSLVSNHDSLSLAIEDRVRRYVRIVQRTSGEVAEGYKFGGVTMDLNMIEITGPKSDVDKVSYGQIDIDIDGVSESLSANIEIELYDAENNALNLSSLTKQSEYVHVEVNILETKRVPIYASKMGTPAEGYIYARNLEVAPETILLAGTKSSLQSISRINITDPVDISGAEGDVEAAIDITPYLPENVSFADDDFDGYVKVTVFVEPEVSQSFAVSPDSVQIVNIPDGYTFTIEPGTLYFEISGLETDINALDIDNTFKEIDVSDWMDLNEIKTLEEGVYDMKVSLNLGSSLRTVGETTARVIVEKTEETGN